MKLITAIVQSNMLGAVIYALEEIEGFPGMTVTETHGFGRGKSIEDGRSPYRSTIAEFPHYIKRMRFDIVARDEMVEEIVRAITRAVRHRGPARRHD